MSEFYLVKDGPRIVSLAAERDGKLYAFVPNVSSFVYNKPMSVDFQIDRGMAYEPVSADAAASIVRAGSIGKIDESTNRFLIDHVRAETRRINPAEILGVSTSAAAELPLAQVANVIADALRKAPIGRWISLGTYPRVARQIALQLASDLRDGLVPAFRDIPLISRVRDNTGDQIVEVSRTTAATAARTARPAPRKVVKKAAAKKAGDKLPVRAARRNPAAATNANAHSSAKSR